MHNERMHEALCRLYPDAPEGSWELACGPETDWDVAIVAWGLEAAPPTQEALDAEYAALAQEDAGPRAPEPEALDLNTITYAQADAIIRADNVEDLRLAMLDVLGL
ncbi:hypothetical protein [Nitratidesulfovibrio liaohensis]|uniref:Bacteriophage SP-beta YorD domain-containing protein n=1 Tax=Nitratidesulfovibrio liaohensis TaxID=2604158 RepID=A0ABY9R4M9_9BACT|nr:hypothetical protein [Nitratidesulfovibrio liaohensis]WMW66715.1 hypothetical protein KPS_001327 [Nitratidesulfovibrio liaohensis]